MNRRDFIKASTALALTPLLSPFTPGTPTLRVFRSTGSYTKPAGLKRVLVVMVGGGDRSR